MWEMCASAGISASSRLSVNSCNPFWKVSSEARLLSLFLEFLGESRQFPGVGSSLHSGAGLEHVRDESFGGLWRGRTGTENLATIQGKQEVWNFPFCRESASLVWSRVAFDRWPTQRFICVLRRVFLVIELPSVSSRICTVTQRSWSWSCTCASSLCGLLHWPLPLFWVSWISAESPVLLSSNSFFSACALMLWSQPRIPIPLEIMKRAPALPWLQLESKNEGSSMLELVDTCRQVPRRSAGASFSGAKFRLASSPHTWGRTFERRLAMDPFLSPILMWCHMPLDR